MIVASYQLERIPAAKSTNLKVTDVKADLKNVLVDWQDGWDNGEDVQQDHSADRQRPGRNRT